MDIVMTEIGERIDIDALQEGAVLVAQSRSGTTLNFRLADGRILSTYQCKSGRVLYDFRDTIDPSLTVRF